MKPLTMVFLFGSAYSLCGAAPLMRVVKPALPGASLLRNGDFEERRGEGPAAWRPYGKGFHLAAGAGRNASAAVTCENPDEPDASGASQTLVLNRTDPAPLVIRGWSRAAGVSGGADSGYSLYADIVYDDGTPLWGRTANFHCGTHDWERREFVILPEKPVKTLTLYCLFRGHSGRVWFDDVAVEEVQAERGAMLFQGVPVVAADANPRLPSRPEVSRVLTNAATAGFFFARDVAADSDFFSFDGGACPELNLKVAANFITKPDHTVVQGRLSDTTGKDRAVTLVFALPVDATGWRWGDDIRRSRVIGGNAEFANQVAVGCGATGTQSLYPLAAIWNDRTGLALALDMAAPAQYHLGYHAGARQFFIAYDFGLVPESERFPSSADFRFVIYQFDPRWGFRAAFQRLMEIFPGYFTVRAKDQGLWMPFTDVSRVNGWEDFGFKFHEGNNNVPWDDAHGILSFRYTEPMTWWIPMKPDVPRTAAEALRIRDVMAEGTNQSQRRMARAARVSAMFDEAGQPALLFRNEPWCNGAVWSLNPNPHVGVPPSGGLDAADRLKAELLPNAATVHWNDALKQQLYGPDAKGQLDGEYLDSLEGYVTADLNFRRDHFRATTVPLTFSTDTKRPALFKGLAVFEFTKWISDDVHRLGRLVFANGVPYRFTFLCPWLDVLGTETDWLRGGDYSPASDAQMSLWRTLSGQKPYLLLMNTDYDAFGPERVEKYFQRSLFYGMWPGMFSHNAADNPYWQNPKWYERDRPLFKKYLPLIRRVAEAGWQPVTEATCDNALIFVERFGPRGNGATYFTLLNDTAQPQSGIFTLDAQAPGGSKAEPVCELPPDETLARSEGGWRLTLQPQQARVLRVAP